MHLGQGFRFENVVILLVLAPAGTKSSSSRAYLNVEMKMIFRFARGKRRAARSVHLKRVLAM
jgi:hypothetical protein